MIVYVSTHKPAEVARLLHLIGGLFGEAPSGDDLKAHLEEGEAIYLRGNYADADLLEEILRCADPEVKVQRQTPPKIMLLK